MALLHHLSDILLIYAARLLNVDYIAFSFPRAWLLLWIFVLLIPWAIRNFRHQLKIARLMEAVLPRWTIFFSKLSFLLALFFLIVTIAEPYGITAIKKPVYKNEAIDFSIDITPSMLATDIAPNRITKVKDELITTVRKLNQSGIATLCLGVFTLSYQRLLECTEDSVNFENVLHGLDSSFAPDQGTDLLAALPDDYDFMKKEVISPKTRITLFIITDGGMGICRDIRTDQFRVLKPDWDEKNLEATLLKFRKDNIRVIPIGVGGKKPVEVRTLDSEGKSIAVTAPNCKFLYTILDEKIIGQIAEWSGDKNRKLLLQNNVSLSDFIEKTILTSREVNSYVMEKNRKELWRYPFILAIIFSFLGSGVLSFIQRLKN